MNHDHDHESPLVALRSSSPSPSWRRRRTVRLDGARQLQERRPSCARVPPTWWPEDAVPRQLHAAVRRLDFGTYFINSTIVAVVVTAGNLLFCSMLGYALAMLDFPGKNVLFVRRHGHAADPRRGHLRAAVRPRGERRARRHPAGAVPAVPRRPRSGSSSCGSSSSACPGTCSTPDGSTAPASCGSSARIILPLCGPALATLGILTFLGSWNNFLWPLVVAQTEDTYTLPVALALYSKGQNATNYGLLLAGATVVVMPDPARLPRLPAQVHRGHRHHRHQVADHPPSTEHSRPRTRPNGAPTMSDPTSSDPTVAARTTRRPLAAALAAPAAATSSSAARRMLAALGSARRERGRPPRRADARTRVLHRWAADTWHSLDAMTDPATGLPADNIPESLAAGDRSGYTSPTNIGGYLWSAVVARELGIISRGGVHAPGSIRTLTTARRDGAPRAERHVLQLVRRGDRRRRSAIWPDERRPGRTPSSPASTTAGSAPPCSSCKNADAGGRPAGRASSSTGCAGTRSTTPATIRRSPDVRPGGLMHGGFYPFDRRPPGRRLPRAPTSAATRRLAHDPPLRHDRLRDPDHELPRHPHRAGPGAALLRAVAHLPGDLRLDAGTRCSRSA